MKSAASSSSGLYGMPKWSATEGAWAKVASKTYRHESGATVRYDCNRYTWEIVGGASDGRGYTSLWAAQYEVQRAAN